ncbi:MAG: DUF6582 domain-containing protein [Rhizomicrobium sp.]
MDFHLFIPITKIDIARRLVTGTIAEEIPDHAGEIMDYQSAKPMFEAWSAEIAKASNGKSVGNLRAMHGSVAAGKLDQIHFDDDARRIATVAKVVDDAEWKKVLEGVYTGFSMGGRYVKRWSDPDQPALTRYTPQPMEVSLVDHPCIPSATFEVLKADGTIELRKFKDAERDISRDTLEFADPGYQRDGKKRYPLDTEAHIRAAWAYIHHEKNQKPYGDDEIAKIKARIVAAWKAKIDRNGPPLAAGKAAGLTRLAKDFGDVSQLALIIDDLSSTLEALNQAGGDTSMPDALRAHIANLVVVLKSLVEQATAGLAGDDNQDDQADGDDEPDDDEPDDGADETADDDDNDDADDGDAAKIAVARGVSGSALRKMLAVVAPRIDAVSARLEDLNKRLEHIEAQPMPGGPVMKTVLVSKAQDLGGANSVSCDPLTAFQRHLQQLPADQRAHLLTKLALRNPVAG